MRAREGGGDCKIEYFLEDLDQERFKYRERFVNTGNPGPIQASPPPPGGGGGDLDGWMESRQLQPPRSESQQTAATVALWMPHR